MLEVRYGVQRGGGGELILDFIQIGLGHEGVRSDTWIKRTDSFTYIAPTTATCQTTSIVKGNRANSLARRRLLRLPSRH